MNSQQLINAINRGVISDEAVSLLVREEFPLSAANKLKAAAILLKSDKTNARIVLQRISMEELCDDIADGRVNPDLITLAVKIWKRSELLQSTIYDSPLAPTQALSLLLPKLSDQQLEAMAKDELRLILAPRLITALLECGRLDENLMQDLKAMQEKIDSDEQLRLREEFDLENLSPETRESLIEESETDEEEVIVDESSNIYVLIKDMTIAEKARLAQKANRNVRMLLVKDSNRLVARSVMRSPRLTENDVEHIARVREVDEEILRMIAQNKLWMRKYSIMKNLTFNPRTPLAVAMTLTKNLSNNDMRSGSRDHNIPTALRQFISKVAQKRGLR